MSFRSTIGGMNRCYKYGVKVYQGSENNKGIRHYSLPQPPLNGSIHACIVSNVFRRPLCGSRYAAISSTERARWRKTFRISTPNDPISNHHTFEPSASTQQQGQVPQGLRIPNIKVPRYGLIFLRSKIRYDWIVQLH